MVMLALIACTSRGNPVVLTRLHCCCRRSGSMDEDSR